MLEVQDNKWKSCSMLEGWEQTFADIDMPDQWINSSWHNDACPSFAFKGWQIWIDEKNLKDREAVSQGFLDSPRFTIMEVNNYSHSKTCEQLENFQDVLDFVNKKIAPFIGRIKRTSY